MVNYKYMIIGRDCNMQPSKVLSKHKTLATAKEKLQTINLTPNFKGADIVSVKKK